MCITSVTAQLKLAKLGVPTELFLRVSFTLASTTYNIAHTFGQALRRKPILGIYGILVVATCFILWMHFKLRL